MNIEEVKKFLKGWVEEGRALKANFIIIILDKNTQKYYPRYTFDENIDVAWETIKDKSGQQPMISFNLNKKVFGVDNAS